VSITAHAVAIEEPAYEVVGSGDGYELRRYDAYIVAETEVQGSFSTAGNKAFRILADYIFGNNSASRKMAMTTPVESAQASDGTKMAMTAPVESREAEPGSDRFVYGFVMEDQYTLETLPMPNNPAISIRRVDGRTVAVHRYSGRWTEANFEKHKRMLLEALARDAIRVTGEPTLARFNGPFTPWFIRRNEVQVSVDLPADGGSP
jgi:hypothetical protein